MHGGRHRDGDSADGFDAVEDLFHVPFVGVESGLIKTAIGPVVHPEQDRDVFRFERCDIRIESVEGILRSVAPDASVVEPEAHGGMTRVEVVLDVLGIQALVRDGVPEENDGVALGEIHFRVDSLEGCLFLRSSILCGDREQGREGGEEDECWQGFHGSGFD